ncbi:MAG: hypothetical protein GYA21_00570 [Myxococcales bacterium]|nr:hypothetical protein [Myxococcales bacterium]
MRTAKKSFKGRLALTILAGLLAAACQDAPVRDDVVGLQVEVTYAAGLSLDRLRFLVIHDRAAYRDPVERPDPPRPLSSTGEQLVFVFPDEMAGQDVTVRVDGLASDALKASGAGSTRLQANRLVVLKVSLGDPARCGDQALAATLEECDDGDAEPGDGCSALCLVEEGWHCDQGSPTTCFHCGDGNCDAGEDLCNCPGECNTTVCGDGSCCLRGGENACSCPQDCQEGLCGDGLCCVSAGENTCDCQLDCGMEVCGNGMCCSKSNETATSCRGDCAFGCGDGACLDAENTCSCPGDCGAGECGDGICCTENQEDRCTCPDDCGQGSCGDGVCCTATGENPCSCSKDCGASACPDGTCCAEGAENRCTCPADCGAGDCGDSICCAIAGENEANCAPDCKAVCPDGHCTTGEDLCSCPQDCLAASCGDGSCCAAAGENPCSCSHDCGVSSCGDGVCCTALGEDRCACPQDCGAGSCGDGVCCAADDENRCTCETDCGGGSCGDGVCCARTGENPCGCPGDCGAPSCGDQDCCPQANENVCSCPADCPGTSTCGDGVCCAATGENKCTCPGDCPGGDCGDGLCCRIRGEDVCTCPRDCGEGTCGDRVCCAPVGEDGTSCPQDCGCGNGSCDAGEDVCNCAQDCSGATCGDNRCCSAGSENPCACPADCGTSLCGDGVCCEATSENPCTCPGDCPGARCGDGTCCAATSEDACNCPVDCPGGSCGDGTCCVATGENTCTCPGDCPGGRCGDGICCATANEDPTSCPDDCGACPNTASGFWLSTSADVSGSGIGGLPSWNAGDALVLGDPNLALEPGGSAGTLSRAFQLSSFAADGSANIDGLHRVGRDLTLGTSGATVEVKAGDLLLSTQDAETLGGIAVNFNDVVRFHPAAPGDYTTGDFTVLFDGAALVISPTSNNLTAFTLVEREVTLPDITLPAGTLLFSQNGPVPRKNLYMYIPTSLGPGTTQGSRTVLLNMIPLGIPSSNPLSGLDILEECVVIGDEILPAGRLLVSVPVSGRLSGMSEDVLPHDVAEIMLTATGTAASGTARLLLRGADLGLDNPAESLDALSIQP